MSISSISLQTRDVQDDWRNTNRERWQAFGHLGNALEAGDLDAAQKAFSALQQLQKGNISGNSRNSPVSSDFKALAQALQSGDLTRAQAAYSKLQSDLKAATHKDTARAVQSASRPGHHHRSVLREIDDSGTGTHVDILA